MMRPGRAVIGLALLGFLAASGAQAASSGPAGALESAVFDFCAPITAGRQPNMPALVAKGFAISVKDAPAPAGLFPPKTPVRQFYALQPPAPGKPSVDGLVADDGARCVIRLLNAPTALSGVMKRLGRRKSGWTLAASASNAAGDSEKRQYVRSVGPVTVAVTVIYSADGSAGPDGINALLTVDRLAKATKP